MHGPYCPCFASCNGHRTPGAQQAVAEVETTVSAPEPAPARTPLESHPTYAATEQFGAAVEAPPPAPHAQVSTSKCIVHACCACQHVCATSAPRLFAAPPTVPVPRSLHAWSLLLVMYF